MIETQVCIIGAGPAGLAASIELAKYGAEVVVVDENARVGGQLFKQIHKFFGSQEHQAGVRGYEIGENLVEEAKRLGVKFLLRTVAYGIFDDKVIGINQIDEERIGLINAKNIILATGAVENALPFPGWTLPGVMSAGAAQTLMNIHGLRPGNRVLMVGSGNVGLIVSYQLLQAGVKVVALVEASSRITGYHVHARKIQRAGVPIFLLTTVKEARGTNNVNEAVLTSLDLNWKPIPEGEWALPIDTICIATGLSPLTELALMAGCKFGYFRDLGGFVPYHNQDMETTVPAIYIAGDISGVEEASSAMEEGRLAGTAVAENLGLIGSDKADLKKKEFRQRLAELREGPFGVARRTAKEDLIKGAV